MATVQITWNGMMASFCSFQIPGNVFVVVVAWLWSYLAPLIGVPHRAVSRVARFAVNGRSVRVAEGPGHHVTCFRLTPVGAQTFTGAAAHRTLARS